MPAVTRLAAVVLCAFAAASAVQAQTQVRPATNVTPSAATRAAQALPRPGGLTPVFPAGISSGSGAAVSSDPIAASTTPVPPGELPPTTVGRTGVPAELPPVDGEPATAVPATTVLGAGAGATVRGPAQRVAGGAGGFSATDTARSFFFADANKDGELTRAEYGRLSIATLTFEETDRNFDGVVSRFEYDDSVR